MSSKAAFLLFTNTLWALDHDLFPYAETKDIRRFVGEFGHIGY